MTTQTTDEGKAKKEMDAVEESINSKQATRAELISELDELVKRSPSEQELVERIKVSLEGRTELEQDSLLKSDGSERALIGKVLNLAASTPEDVAAVVKEVRTMVETVEELRSVLKDPFRIKVLSRLNAGSLRLITYQTRCPFTGAYGDRKVRLTFANEVLIDAGAHAVDLAAKMFKDLSANE